TLVTTDPPRPEIYTLSLHDALPICTPNRCCRRQDFGADAMSCTQTFERNLINSDDGAKGSGDEMKFILYNQFRWTDRLTSEEGRSEEHTSELQSRENLVCRLLLEKK